ncbi:Vegetative incompatibility protein HET-E-1 [Colletotrichum fructicola]|nr:Vegetative incompatibility protein HET-E-1 [Colletotrichum fructicola]
MEPADAPSDPFEVSLTTFKATLKKSEVENFRFATGDEFKTAIDQIQTKLHHKRRQLNLTKLRSFVEAMTQFGKVLDVFCQTSETIAFIWGPWKFLLQNVDSLFTAFDEILDTYDQLGQTLSLVLQATELFPEDKQMVKVVASIYDDILAFHREAFRYFQKSNAKRFIHAIFQTYQKTFEDLIQAIKRHQQILLGQSTFSEARRARANDERMRLQILETGQSRVRRELVLWLKGANTQNDHDRLLRIREEFPTTGVWLLSKPEFKGWFERYTSRPPMLWLNGVPGAGKTVLSSIVIENCKALAHQPHVLYFYCKGGDPDRDNLSAIGRSLLLQLLKEDSDVMQWIYQEYKDSTEEFHIGNDTEVMRRDVPPRKPDRRELNGTTDCGGLGE